MFIWAVTISFLFFLFLIVREQIKYPPLSTHTFKKTVKIIMEHLALHEWEEAEKALHQLKEKGKKHKEIALLHIQLLRGTQRFSEALSLALSEAREFPEELLFRLEEAKIQLMMGKPEESIAAFRVCAPILRAESDYYDCALAYFQVGRIGTCWEMIESKLEGSQNEKLLALAGDCQFERKNYAEAVSLYQKAIEKGSFNHLLMNQLGHAFRKLGNLHEAEKLFRKILEKDSSNIAATLGIGACLQERGHHLKALLFYQAGDTWAKNDPRILHQAALCALLAKRFHYASAYFSELIKTQGPSAQLLFYLGYSFEGELKWQEAEQTYLHLVKEFPSDIRGYRALAWLFGVGLSKTLSAEQGLSFAYVALKAQSDFISWEIVSACEARHGNFQKAHDIQEYLLSFEKDPVRRSERQQAMRTLRKRLPLDDRPGHHTQVA